MEQEITEEIRGAAGGRGSDGGVGGGDAGANPDRQAPSAAACVLQKRVPSLSHLYHVPSLHGSAWPHLPVHRLNPPLDWHEEEEDHCW